jgi:hypothetical protein
LLLVLADERLAGGLLLGRVRVDGDDLVRGLVLAPERGRVVHLVALVLRQRVPPRLDLRAVVRRPQEVANGLKRLNPRPELVWRRKVGTPIYRGGAPRSSSRAPPHALQRFGD